MSVVARYVRVSEGMQVYAWQLLKGVMRRPLPPHLQELYDSLAGERGGSESITDLIENKLGVADREESMQYIHLLGLLGGGRAFKILLFTLAKCDLVAEDAKKGVLTEESNRFDLGIASECCHALALIDTQASHRVLLQRWAMAPTFHLRLAALGEMGVERKQYDIGLILRLASPNQPVAIRVEALLVVADKINRRTWRLYRDCLVESLLDNSPCVRVAAIASVCYVPISYRADLVRPLIEDRRYCRMLRQRVSDVAAEWLKAFE